jgi:uncharacterized protein (DUF952 family)
MLIYHIVLPEIWERASGDAEYAAESLATEGFIHCSYRNQLDDVLARYYRDAGRVFILHINAHRLTSHLVSEPSTGGEIYPHVYGPINRAAVVEVEERRLTLG